MNDSFSKNDDEKYFKYNSLFHQVYLDISGNEILLKYTNTLKHRLYDFSTIPYDQKWKEDNSKEHDMLLNLLDSKKYQEASNFIRDVHWVKYPESYFDPSGNRT